MLDNVPKEIISKSIMYVCIKINPSKIPSSLLFMLIAVLFVRLFENYCNVNVNNRNALLHALNFKSKKKEKRNMEA